MRLIAALIACVACAGACTKAPEAALAPPFNSEIGIVEFMEHGMEPAARAFWAGWGEVWDEKGMHEIAPKNDEEWKKVEDGAAMIVIASNTLMLPQYTQQPASEWIKWAKQTSDLGILAMQAADGRDRAAMDTVGSDLYTACHGCHEAFRPKGGRPGAGS